MTSYCRECGNELMDNDNICEKCGNKVESLSNKNESSGDIVKTLAVLSIVLGLMGFGYESLSLAGLIIATVGLLNQNLKHQNLFVAGLWISISSLAINAILYIIFMLM